MLGGQLQFERTQAPTTPALTTEQREIQQLKARIHQLEQEKMILKKLQLSYVRRIQIYALIDKLRKLSPVKLLCHAFGVLRSSYYHYSMTHKSSNPDRTKLKVIIKSVFKQSCCSLGSRGIRSMLLNQGIKVGRYLIHKLMRESGLVSKQHKKRKYQSNVGDIPLVPNTLNRQFKSVQPNHVWSSDITYIWTCKTWAYLAVVLVRVELLIGLCQHKQISV